MLDPELIEYLDRRFEKIDQRFAENDRRFDVIDRQFEVIDRRFDDAQQDRNSLRAELIRRIGIVEEQLRDEIQTVAEGVIGVNARLDRFQEDVQSEFEETRSMIKLSYSELDRRLRNLESRTDDLDARLRRLETTNA